MTTIASADALSPTTAAAAKPKKSTKPRTVGDLIKLARRKRRQGKTLHFLAYLDELCPETGVPFFKLMCDFESQELCIEEVEWEEAREMLRPLSAT